MSAPKQTEWSQSVILAMRHAQSVINVSRTIPRDIDNTFYAQVAAKELHKIIDIITRMHGEFIDLMVKAELRMTEPVADFVEYRKKRGPRRLRSVPTDQPPRPAA